MEVEGEGGLEWSVSTARAPSWRPLLFSPPPFAHASRGARLLSPLSWHGDTRTAAAPPAPPRPLPISRVHRSGGRGGSRRGVLSRAQRPAGAAAPGTHGEKGAARIFLFSSFFLAGAGRGVGGRAARAEGRAAAFPWITSLVSQGRNLRGAPQTN